VIKDQIKFTVILPVCHGGSFLRSALCSLRDVSFPPERFEVLVAGADYDTESIDMVQAESRQSQFDIKYVGCHEHKRSRQLNEACRLAQGCVLVFTDDDCIFQKEWLEKLNEVFEHESDIGIVGGEDILESKESTFDLALDSVLNSFIGTGGLRSGNGIRTGKYYPKLWNMAVPREVALKVAIATKQGLTCIFDESLDVHEDVDLADRIEQSGKRIVFAPEVRVRHFRDTTYRAFVKRNFNMARTSRALRIHSLPHVALSVFVLITSLLAIFSIFISTLRFIFLILVGIYILLLQSSAVQGFMRTKNLCVFAIIPGLLASLHFSRGLGYLFPWRDRNRREICL